MRIAITLALLLLASCVTDYRTDYERNNGIVLTEYQIELRKLQRKYNLEAFNKYAKEAQDKMRMERMVRCHTGNYLDCL